MRIAVLALQGAFIEHEQMLQRLGVETFEVRQLRDWQQPKDGLILPGGESTVQMRLLNELGLFAPIRQAILDGMPVFGTCAGMILLSEGRLGTMHIQVRRNAYGRQLGSFHTVGSVTDIGSDVPMTFIRAPYIETITADDCQALATVEGHIVAARQGNQLATAFHPELDNDPRLHQYFLNIIKSPTRDRPQRPDLYSPIQEKKVFQEASTHSGISAGVIKAAWDAAGEVIRTWATEGHSIPIPGLGTMRFGVRSKAVEKLEDVKTSLISVRRIIFTPNVDVKDELKNTSIQITCLDEEGNVLKRVTSGDSGDVEDPEAENQGGENQNGGNTNQGGNTGGGGNQGGGGGGDDSPIDDD